MASQLSSAGFFFPHADSCWFSSRAETLTGVKFAAEIHTLFPSATSPPLQLKLEEFLPSVVVVSPPPTFFFFEEIFDRDTFSRFNFGNEVM